MLPRPTLSPVLHVRASHIPPAAFPSRHGTTLVGGHAWALWTARAAIRADSGDSPRIAPVLSFSNVPHTVPREVSASFALVAALPFHVRRAVCEPCLSNLAAVHTRCVRRCRVEVLVGHRVLLRVVLIVFARPCRQREAGAGRETRGDTAPRR
jgi:hypothetical protein